MLWSNGSGPRRSEEKTESGESGRLAPHCQAKRLRSNNAVQCIDQIATPMQRGPVFGEVLKLLSSAGSSVVALGRQSLLLASSKPAT